MESRAIGSNLLFDGQYIGIARLADAQGGRCAEVALLYLDVGIAVEIGRKLTDEIFAFYFQC